MNLYTYNNHRSLLKQISLFIGNTLTEKFLSCYPNCQIIYAPKLVMVITLFCKVLYIILYQYFPFLDYIAVTNCSLISNYLQWALLNEKRVFLLPSQAPSIKQRIEIDGSNSLLLSLGLSCCFQDPYKKSSSVPVLLNTPI